MTMIPEAKDMWAVVWSFKGDPLDDSMYGVAYTYRVVGYDFDPEYTDARVYLVGRDGEMTTLSAVQFQVAADTYDHSLDHDSQWMVNTEIVPGHVLALNLDPYDAPIRRPFHEYVQRIALNDQEEFIFNFTNLPREAVSKHYREIGGYEEEEATA